MYISSPYCKVHNRVIYISSYYSFYSLILFTTHFNIALRFLPMEVTQELDTVIVCHQSKQP